MILYNKYSDAVVKCIESLDSVRENIGIYDFDNITLMFPLPIEHLKNSTNPSEKLLLLLIESINKFIEHKDIVSKTDSLLSTYKDISNFITNIFIIMTYLDDDGGLIVPDKVGNLQLLLLTLKYFHDSIKCKNTNYENFLQLFDQCLSKDEEVRILFSSITNNM